MSETADGSPLRRPDSLGEAEIVEGAAVKVDMGDGAEGGIVLDVERFELPGAPDRVTIKRHNEPDLNVAATRVDPVSGSEEQLVRGLVNDD